MTIGGVVRLWQVGDVIYAENDFCRVAYVITDDPAKIGKFGWYGPDPMVVEYISRLEPVE